MMLVCIAVVRKVGALEPKPVDKRRETSADPDSLAAVVSAESLRRLAI